MLWYDEKGVRQTLPALDVPRERILDTNGAGDIFHGAYVYSAMAQPQARWRDHFVFARAASAHSIQHLGNEASLPSIVDVQMTERAFSEKVPEAAQ
jgi:sugar/nucleoside kinase (ribokinase family)